jgi:hypothetical protein
MARNYAKEYANYQGTPEQLKRQSERHKARRLMIKKYGKAAVAGKDVDHKDMNTGHNTLSNLRIQSKSANRSRNKPHLGK